MKKKLIAGLLVAAVLSGCSIFEKRDTDYKTGAVQAPSLEVPPDLVGIISEPRYAIPAADGTKSAKYSDYSRDKMGAQSQVAAACPPSAPVSAQTTPVAAAKSLEVAGVRFILLSEPFDRSWRKIGLALEHARIAVADIDRSKGTYFLKPSIKDKKNAEIQVLVHEASGVTDVTVKEGGALHTQEAARVLDAIYQNLEK